MIKKTAIEEVRINVSIGRKTQRMKNVQFEVMKSQKELAICL